MFDWLFKGLGAMLAWFSSITGSYALALLLYALVFKILFLFFSVKQQKNQIAMAKLAPKIELIKAKYRGRNDQATLRKQQEEIMALQQKEGYNAFSGCLPMLLQLPIILILYQVIRKPFSYLMNISNENVVGLYNYVNGRTDGVIDKIDQIKLIDQIDVYLSKFSTSYPDSILADAGLPSVSAIPNFRLFGTSLAPTPADAGWTWLILIPFIAAGFQWLSMFITRKLSGNANQLAATDANGNDAQMSLRMMDLVLPLMTVFMAFSFSAMLGVYWVFQSILGIIQTLIFAKLMPVPKYTEEEIKELRKAQKAQEKQQKAIMKTQPKYKSLHYIDEDDYDDLREVQSKDGKKNNQKPLGSSADKPEVKD